MNALGGRQIDTHYEQKHFHNPVALASTRLVWNWWGQGLTSLTASDSFALDPYRCNEKFNLMWLDCKHYILAIRLLFNTLFMLLLILNHCTFEIQSLDNNYSSWMITTRYSYHPVMLYLSPNTFLWCMAFFGYKLIYYHNNHNRLR